MLAVLAAGSLVTMVAVGQVELPRMGDARFMPVSELRPGMTGYGLSVLRGTAPERFDIEVIDVLHDFRPDQDLILVRTSHPVLDEAHVVGGMSGSPIYVDDRMIGAYAYGWPYGAASVVGVTPIENMLREIDRSVRPGSFPGAGALPTAATSERRAMLGLPAYDGARPRGAFAALHEHAEHLGLSDGERGSSTLVPASTPMLVGGLHEAAVERLARELSPFGIEVLQAGGSGGDEAAAGGTTPGGFVDGGAIAVTLARGDVTNDVIGTVTYVDGNRLVAFGHPMVEAGETGVPTAIARVLHVFASLQRSFKIAEPLAALGALIEDRQAAIVVDTNVTPEVIPVVVRLRGLPDTERSEWRFEVASHRAVTPTVIASAIQSAVQSSAGDHAWVTYDAIGRVEISGITSPIVVHDHGFASNGVHAASTLDDLRIFDLIDAAYGNAFVDTRPMRVELDLGLTFERHTAEIVDASVSQTVVDPGEDVTVRIVLRPFEGDEEIRSVTIHVPESAAGEEISILVQPGVDADVERPDPRSLDDVVAAVRDRYAATSIVVSTRRSSRGLRMGGHVVRALPGSALDALESTAHSDRARPFVTHDRTEITGDRVLSGGAHLELTVRSLERDADE